MGKIKLAGIGKFKVSQKCGYIRGKDRPRILIYVDTINGMVEHVFPDGVSFEEIGRAHV